MNREKVLIWFFAATKKNKFGTQCLNPRHIFRIHFKNNSEHQKYKYWILVFKCDFFFLRNNKSHLPGPCFVC